MLTWTNWVCVTMFRFNSCEYLYYAEGATLAESKTKRVTKERIKNNLKNQADYDALKAQKNDLATDPVGTPNNPSTQIFTVANVITFCRLLLTFAFLYLFITGSNRMLALVLYAVAASTDFFDGQIARRTQTVSWVGKIMDPIMDRVLLFTGVLGLVATGELPLWMAVFVIGRDVYLAIGAQILQHYRRRPIDVVFVGKLTTALLMIGFCDLLLGIPVLQGTNLVTVSWLPLLNGESAALGMVFVYLGLVFSTITAVVYTIEGVKVIQRSHANNESHKEA